MNSTSAEFDQRYQSHLKHLKLKGLQPKTIDVYAHLTGHTTEQASARIDALMSRFTLDWASVR